MITDTVSAPELIWTLFCLGGVIYAIKLFAKSADDVIYLSREKLDGLMMLREYSANTNLLTYFGIMINQLVYVILGIIFMLIPSPHDHIATTTYVISAVFVLGSAVKTVIIFLLERRRDRLIEMIKEYDAGST